MKNTLIFLVTEGLGLNRKWKGNYLKLSNKPNINFLISGIYPWALVSNATKKDKKKENKKLNAVSQDTDLNFYQMLSGNRKATTFNKKFEEVIESKTLLDLKVFSDLKEHAELTKNDRVHIFFMLSDNKNHCKKDYLSFTINALIKKGLRPMIHLVADGQDDKPYTFSDHVIEFEKFAKKRGVPIGTVVGRNHVFIRNGHNHLENQHVFEYFKTICGLGQTTFNLPSDYAAENLAVKTMDADIAPAYSTLVYDYALKTNDAIMFLDADPDSFSCLASMIKTEQNYKDVYVASLAPIYGIKADTLFFGEEINEFDWMLTDLIEKEDKNALILALNHKKGFIQKFYGPKKSKNIERKVISTSFAQNEFDYQVSAAKALIDKTIKSIGQYDIVIVHMPMIAEAAKTSNLKLLNFAIETVDKNIGRLINFCRTTGNVIAFASAYGTAEKMLNNRMNIIPYVKNSIVPFVFTNGEVSSKKLVSDFVGIHATVATTLGLTDLDDTVVGRSLITTGFNKDKIRDRLVDSYESWRDGIALPVIEDFENNRMNFYADFSKDEEYIKQKRQYVVLKEIISLHERVFTTPDARKKIYEKITNYIEYNNIDFVGFPYNYTYLLTTLFDDDIQLQKLSKLSNKYFDNKIWSTNFKRNVKWIDKAKFDIKEQSDRQIPESNYDKIIKRAERRIDPFLYFTKFQESELEILETNDAVKIAEFYEAVGDDVKDVYDTYVAPKLHDEDDEVDEEQMEFEKQYYWIEIYIEYFQEVLDFVKENKDKVTLFNQKYEENKPYFKNKETDIFKKHPTELNQMTKGIVNIYKGYNIDMRNFRNQQATNKKQQINRFNTEYQNKCNIALQAQTYDGEFLEGVDLSAQGDFEEKFVQKVKDYNEFDFQWLPGEDQVQRVEDQALLDILEEERVIEEGTDGIVVDNIDNETVRTRPEYDLTDLWTESRLEEINNKDKVKVNVSLDAEKEVNIHRTIKNAEKRLDQYDDLSNTWKNESKKTADLGSE